MVIQPYKTYLFVMWIYLVCETSRYRGEIMNEVKKSEKTGVRLRPLLKGNMPVAARLRGVKSESEYIRFLIINDFCRLDLLPPMTEDERLNEARR